MLMFKVCDRSAKLSSLVWKITILFVAFNSNQSISELVRIEISSSSNKKFVSREIQKNMLMEKYPVLYRTSLCCLALVLVVFLILVALLIAGSNPVCFKFDCASNKTVILGKLIRYPKNFGVRKFSEDRDAARAAEALKLGRVFLRSLHFDSGLFSATMNDSANFSEFLILCPKLLLQENRQDCLFPDYMPHLMS